MGDEISTHHDLGTFVIVSESSGDTVLVPGEHFGLIDASVGEYLTEGRDALLCLTALSGDDYRVRASQIVSFIRSTPEGRERGKAIDRVLNALVRDAEDDGESWRS